MSHDALLKSAVENTEAAQRGLQTIHTTGVNQPVPAQMFTNVLVNLRNGMSAIIELERRARGGDMPKQG